MGGECGGGYGDVEELGGGGGESLEVRGRGFVMEVLWEVGLGAKGRIGRIEVIRA